MASAPAGNRRVVGDRIHAFARRPDLADLLAFHGLDRAAEGHRVRDLRALELPGIAEGQPVLGILFLPAILDYLPEKAVVIADAVAIGGDREGRHALHEARREAAKAAIAEGGVRLDLAQVLKVNAQAFQRAAD